MRIAARPRKTRRVRLTARLPLEYTQYWWKVEGAASRTSIFGAGLIHSIAEESDRQDATQSFVPAPGSPAPKARVAGRLRGA